LGYINWKEPRFFLILDRSQQLKLFSGSKIWYYCFIVLPICKWIQYAFWTLISLEALEFYMKIWNAFVIYFFFFYFSRISILAIYLVFGVYRFFDDLRKQTKKKYAKSSLSDFFLICSSNSRKVVRKNSCFFDFDIKLNTLADKLHISVHHIHRAIVIRTHKMSFPDYINQYRIEVAKN